MATFVEVQGENLALEIYQPKEHRADVVLVHGWTGSKEDFNLIGPLLADQGYRVLTFDNRGQHESPHSQRSGAYEALSLATDINELVAKVGLSKPHLLGHSFGGLISQRAVVESPENWASLTLFCSGPGALTDKPDLEKSVEILGALTMQQSWDQYKEETDKFLPRYELYKKRWTASDPHSTRTMAVHLLQAQSLIDRLAVIALPVHVIYGENDDAWPLAAQDQMARDLSAPCTIIKNAGHCPNEDQPEETARVLANFWSAL